MTREMEFRMERAGLVIAGDVVEIDEYQHSTLAGLMYYYVVKPAAAMSNNTPERLQKLQGTVKTVTEEDGVYTVIVIFD